MQNSNHKQIQDRVLKEIAEDGKIAKFFGFLPIIPPVLGKQDFDNTKDFDPEFHPEERAALLRIYFEEKMVALSQPVMFYCERPFKGHKDSQRKKPSWLESTLVSMGSFKSVCECLSIQTALNILNAVGYKNLMVEINSVGDKESASEFQKKFSIFIRKNFNSFPPELRQATKKDQFALLKSKNDEWKEWRENAPHSIDFLTETSRLHFKELLEFFETMDIPYEMNCNLTGDVDIGSETVFSIKNADDDKNDELAFGFRYNRMAKKVGCKKELPCTFLNISAKIKKALKKVKAKPIKPKFYLVQFGPEAKLKSFLILNDLYKAGASVIHSIAKDKLGSQMGAAESSGASYILLMGQKEALENSIIIRNNENRAQEVVSLPNFAAKIKELD